MRPEYVKELLAPTLNARHLAKYNRRISLTSVMVWEIGWVALVKPEAFWVEREKKF